MQRLLQVKGFSQWQWAYAASDPTTTTFTNDFGNANVADGSNYYVTGDFYDAAPYGDASFNGVNATGNDNKAAFVAKYSLNGATCLWVRAYTSTPGYAQDVRGKAIAESGGFLYVTGEFYGTVDFGNGYVFTATQYETDVFVLKLNKINGNTEWARQLGSSASFDEANGIVFRNGRVHVTGHYSDKLFVTKLADTNGSNFWAGGEILSGSTTGGFMVGNSLTVDGGGNIYVLGNMHGTNTIYNATGTAYVTYSSVDNDAFVIKFNVAGAGVVNRRIGFSDNAEDGQGINYGAGTGGGIFITGSIYDVQPSTLTYFNTSSGPFLASAGNKDVFTAKYDTGLNLIFENSFGDAGYEEGMAISNDSQNNYYVYCNTYESSATVGSGTLVNTQLYRILIVKYSSSGTILGFEQKENSIPSAPNAGNTLTGYGNAIDARTGCAFVTGGFMGFTNPFGATILSSVTGVTFDIFTANYCPTYRLGASLSDDLNKDNMLVYYNSNEQRINAFVNEDGVNEVYLKLVDVAGKIIIDRTISLHNNRSSIDAGNLANGIYFVELIVNNKRTTQKFAVQK